MRAVTIILMSFFSLAFSGMAYAKSCSSDFSCGIGQTCVKAPYKTRGTCMKTVNQYGTQQYNMPSTRSVGPNMSGGSCKFSTDCPIGFKCDRRLKACIKR